MTNLHLDTSPCELETYETEEEGMYFTWERFDSDHHPPQFHKKSNWQTVVGKMLNGFSAKLGAASDH